MKTPGLYAQAAKVMEERSQGTIELPSVRYACNAIQIVSDHVLEIYQPACQLMKHWFAPGSSHHAWLSDPELHGGYEKVPAVYAPEHQDLRILALCFMNALEEADDLYTKDEEA